MTMTTPKIKIAEPKAGSSGDFSEVFSKFLQLTAQFYPAYPSLASVTCASCTIEGSDTRRIAIVTINIQEDAIPDFCEAVMKPESAPLVNTVSTHGFLGFSPAEGSPLETPWNMKAFETCYANNAEHMKTFHLDGLKWFSKRELPMWLQIATFALGTGIQTCFLCTIAKGGVGGAGVIAARQAQREVKLSWVGAATETSTALIKAIAKENEHTKTKPLILQSEDDGAKIYSQAKGNFASG